MIPVFKRKGDGSLVLSDSAEAMAVKKEQRQKHYVPLKAPAVVRGDAEKRVECQGGDVGNTQHLLGQFKIQFGAYRLVSSNLYNLCCNENMIHTDVR